MAFLKFSKGKVYEVGGDGSGWTMDSPFYWYRHTTDWHITSGLNTSGSPESYERSIYFRVKLKGGVAYSLGTYGEFDGKCWLYNESGTEVAVNDDGSAEVNAEYYSDVINYTPSADGIFIFRAGAYSDGQGDIRVCCYPQPEQEEIPQSTTVYETSSGFDEFGYPIRYDIASECGISYTTIPTDNLILYMALKENRTSPEVVDSDVFSTNYEGNYNSANYQVMDNVPCLYLDSNSNITLTRGNKEIRQATFAYWGKFDDLSQCIITNSYDTSACVNGGAEFWLAFSATNAYFTSGSADGNIIYVDISISPEWHHIAVTWDMDTNYMYLYLDGVLIGQCTDQSWLAPNINRSGFILSVNNLYRASSVVYGNGHYSSVRMYDRVLTKNEIKALAKEF